MSSFNKPIDLFEVRRFAMENEWYLPARLRIAGCLTETVMIHFFRSGMGAAVLRGPETDSPIDPKKFLWNVEFIDGSFVLTATLNSIYIKPDDEVEEAD